MSVSLPDFDWNSPERLSKIDHLLASLLISRYSATTLAEDVWLAIEEYASQAGALTETVQGSETTKSFSAILMAVLRFLNSLQSEKHQREHRLALELLPLGTEIRNLLLVHLKKAKTLTDVMRLPWHRIFEVVVTFMLGKLDALGRTRAGDELWSRVFYLPHALPSVIVENDYEETMQSFSISTTDMTEADPSPSNTDTPQKKRKRSLPPEDSDSDTTQQDEANASLVLLKELANSAVKKRRRYSRTQCECTF